MKLLTKGDSILFSKCQWQRAKKEFIRQIDSSQIKNFRSNYTKFKKCSKKKIDVLLDSFTSEDFFASLVILMKILGSTDRIPTSKFSESVKCLFESALDRKKAWAYPDLFKEAWEVKFDAGKIRESVSGSAISVFYDHLRIKHLIAKNDVIYFGIEAMENWKSFQDFAETSLFPRLKRKINRKYIRMVFQVTLDLLRFMKSDKWDKL